MLRSWIEKLYVCHDLLAYAGTYHTENRRNWATMQVMETGPLLLYRYLSVPSKLQGCNRVESCRAFPKKIITLRLAFETPNIPKTLLDIWVHCSFFFYQRITLLRNRQLNAYAKITELSSSYLLINSFGLSICATHITLGLVGMPSYPYLFSVVQISR